jgi:polysaccharide export outer membrane protein
VNRRIVPKAVWGNGVVRLPLHVASIVAISCYVFSASVAGAQTTTAQSPAAAEPAPQPAQSAPAGVTPPPGYVIGADDVLSIVVWREKEMSSEVVVRPDGKISLPLVNDLQAAGLTPEQLRSAVEKAAAKWVKEPDATVIVKTINSRKVSILGNVGKAGTYPLTGEMTVLQLIAQAGGLQEYADAKGITIMRKQDGRDVTLKFNYKDVVKGKNLQQNVSLKPGDTVIVP